MPEQGQPLRPQSQRGPIDAHLAYVNSMLRSMVARCGLTLHTGIEGLWVRPTVFPPSAAISPDVYGDRTGPWGDGAGWLEYWAELGTGWVNLGLAVGTDGLPHIAYESQWRKGDQFERLPDDDYPAFNFNG